MAAKKKRIQRLGLIDKLIRALLELDVPLILGWDGSLNVYLVAVLADETCDDDPPFDQKDWVEYQVSDGLPGARSESNSYYSFKEAQEGFDEMCSDIRKGDEKARQARRLSGRVG